MPVQSLVTSASATCSECALRFLYVQSNLSSVTHVTRLHHSLPALCRRQHWIQHFDQLCPASQTPFSTSRPLSHKYRPAGLATFKSQGRWAICTVVERTPPSCRNRGVLSLAGNSRLGSVYTSMWVGFFFLSLPKQTTKHFCESLEIRLPDR